jgi:magnesium transporter
LISHIDDEVDEIDTLVIDPSNIVIKEKAKVEHLPLEALNINPDKTEVFELQEKINMDEKSVPAKPKKKKKKRRPLSKRIRRGWKHLRRAILARHIRWQIWFSQSKVGEAMNVAFQYLRKASGMRRAHRANQSAAFQPVFDRTSLLQRMTEMRRLVTGLTRLLGAKHQVIKRLRKRAAIKGGEVGVYISDVQGEHGTFSRLDARLPVLHFTQTIS